MLEHIQQVGAQHKMRLSFHFGASKLALLSLALLCPVPRTVTSYPLPPTAEPESALLHLQTALDHLKADWLLRPDTWAPREEMEEEEEEEEEGVSLEEEALLRAQRGDLVVRALSPLPGGGHPLEIRKYEEGGEVEDGGKRNDALTSIAGGLQAVGREKGGFGFRFGRKRWTERGWMD